MLRRTLLGLLVLSLPTLVHAQARPTLALAPGVMIVSFETPDGVIRAYLPDDVAPGERFSGSVTGPSGYAVRLGTQRVNTGGLFRWTAPADGADEPLRIFFMRRTGADLASVSLQPKTPDARETTLKIPPVVQAGSPFPVRGPFDGDATTTHVAIGGVVAPLLAESARKAIIRAPDGATGVVTFDVREQRFGESGSLRSLAMTLSPTPAADATRELRVAGLTGISRDVPIDVAGAHFYIKPGDVPADGTLTLRRRFAVDAESAAVPLLVIPESPRDEVAVVLRTPLREAGGVLAQQHARDLRALDFDAIPATAELLRDDRLANEAAHALIAFDEIRGMGLLFESMPRSGLSVERIGLVWFLEHQDTIGDAVDDQAHDAAQRVLARIASTATAELALYTLGFTGSRADFPLLERFATTTATGAQVLRAASQTALARLGSRPHIEAIKAELAMPLPERARYSQGVRLAQTLRQAALSGAPEFVPAICGHITDPKVIEIDISVDLGLVASNALSRILEAAPARTSPATRRSQDEWKAYCRGLL